MTDASDSRERERAEFIDRFGHIFEHSPWIPEAAFDQGLPEGVDMAETLHRVFCAVLRDASKDRKLALIHGHPDLAGRLARGGDLTTESTGEQSSAGLDRLTDNEFERFTSLNTAYREKFGFPFIMAVKRRSKEEILAAFESRLENAPEAEFETALAQIERIALLRLQDLLP